MNQPRDKEREKLLRKAFRMPGVQTMRSRKSTVTNAFVNALVPLVKPSLDDIEQALAVLGMDAADVRCAYCGDRFTEWDHLRPLVIGRRPTGYIFEIANLVPSCNKCNQSKGNEPWREWMVGAADRSPTARLVGDAALRIERLEAYERWRSPTLVDFRAIIPAGEWEEYWGLLDKVVGELERCQVIADDIHNRVAGAMAGLPGREFGVARLRGVGRKGKG